jgi:hypothetical protein
MTVGWLGAEHSDGSGDEVEELFEEYYISAGELILRLTVALEQCNKTLNMHTITALKTAWNSCAQAAMELNQFLRHSHDATREKDLNKLGKCLDEHREEVLLRTISDSNYSFWNPPAADPVEWIVGGDPVQWGETLALRRSLAERIFMYGRGLSSNDSFIFKLTLESESQFRPLLDSIQSVIEMIKKPIITSGTVPVVLRSFRTVILDDKEKIEGIILWTKAFGIKKSLTDTLALFEQRINAGSVGSGYLQVLDGVRAELRNVERLVSSKLVTVCLILEKQHVFNGEISSLKTKLKELSDRCIADMKRFQPDKEVRSSWDSEISRLLDNIESYEARLREGDFREEFINEILLLRVQYQQLIPVLSKTHVNYLHRVNTAWDTAKMHSQDDLDKLNKRMEVAKTCDMRAERLIRQLRVIFPDHP